MKKTSIKVEEDLALRLNQLKYLWQLKSQDAVIRRLIEICSKIETAHSLSKLNSGAGSSKNSASTSNVKNAKDK